MQQATLRVADVVGALMEFWGFKRQMGRVWTLLYLSPEPSSAADLSERLTMSAGAVSMAVGELLKWGAVRKIWRPGERRDYYEAETSIWKMVTRVMRERELTLVRDAAEAFDAARVALSQAAQGAAPEVRERLLFALARLEQLSALARLGESLLRALVAGERVDPTMIREASTHK